MNENIPKLKTLQGGEGRKDLEAINEGSIETAEIEKVAEGIRAANEGVERAKDIIMEHKNDPSFMKRLREVSKGKFKTLAASVLLMLNTLGTKANETKGELSGSLTEKTISLDKETDVKGDSTKVLTREDFKEKGSGEKKENVIKIFKFRNSFELGVRNLNEKQKENLEKEIDTFIESLTEQERKDILEGKILVHFHGEASHEKILNDLVMEDGTVIHKGEKGNEELAEYRAREIARAFFKKLEKDGDDISKVKIAITYPKGGVSEKDQRVAEVELRILNEKSTENILNALKDNIIAGIEDASGSIDHTEAEKIHNFFDELEKNKSEFKHLILEGGDNESHIQTLEHLFYRVDGFKEKKGIVLVGTDERDASWHNDINIWEKYAKRAEDLMGKYKESGKKVIVQVFSPDGSGNFKLVDLTEHPLALQVKADNKREYKEVIDGMKGQEQWYNNLPDSSVEILSGLYKGADNDQLIRVFNGKEYQMTYHISPEELTKTDENSSQ